MPELMEHGVFFAMLVRHISSGTRLKIGRMRIRFVCDDMAIALHEIVTGV